MMDREEQIISALLEADPLTLPSGRDLSDEELTLERLYTEVLGLLPLGLQPLAPRPEAKAKLMALIEASPAAKLRAQPAPSAPSVAEPTDIMAPVVSLSSSPAAQQRQRETAPHSSMPAPHRASRWPWALAAAFAVAMIGMGMMMSARLRQSETRVAQLQEELGRLAVEQGEWRKARNEMASISERFEAITAPGVEICPLRAPKGKDGVNSNASGVIYMADSQWWVKVNGLDPIPADRAYQLWFDTDVGPVSGGTFVVATNREPIELAAEAMPTGTQAIRVTLEAAGGAEEPTGPTVLFGDQRMTLL